LFVLHVMGGTAVTEDFIAHTTIVTAREEIEMLR
jgi:hypothetical protein